MFSGTRRPPRVLLWAVAILAASGCADERLQAVKGKVTFQGRDVPEGVVVFSNESAGISLTTKLNPDGTFTVGSYKGMGLPVDRYMIAIRPPIAETMAAEELKTLKRKFVMIPEIYRDPKTSGLTANVRLGPNDFTFDMQP